MSLSMQEVQERLKKEKITPSWQAQKKVVTPTPTPQKKPGFFSDPETGMNIVKGIGKGVFSTIASAGSLGTRTLGRLVGAQDIEGTTRMVQNLKETTLKPKNTAQSIGFGAEQMAELFIPIFGQEAAGTKIASKLASKSAGKIATMAGKVGAQALTEGADIGVKRLAQTGDPKQAAIEAGLTTVATPAVLGAGKLVNEAYKAVNPSTKQLFTSALKPSVKQKNFDLDLDESIPVLAKYADQIASSEAPLHAMDSAVKASKAELWSSIKDAVAGTSGSASVDGSRLAVAIRQATKSKKASIESPQIISRLEEKAKAYEGQMIDPVEAEQLLEETNATLQAYYSKNKVSQATAQKADPELLADIKLAEDLRTQLDEIVSTVGSKFADAKKRYGALSSIEQALASRIPVAERANITSLAEQISGARTAGNVLINLASGRPMQAFASLGDLGSAKLLKELETSGSKLSRAFGNISKEVKSGKIKIAETPKFTREQFTALPEGQTVFAGEGAKPMTPDTSGAVPQEEAIRKLRELGYQGPLDLEDMTKAQREDAALRLKAWIDKNSPKAQAVENVKVSGMPTAETKVPTIKSVTTKESVDPLISEAKKYKSADEFVKGQGDTMYHGTASEFENFDISKTGMHKGSDWGNGVYLTPSESEANRYALDASLNTKGKPITKSFSISKNAKMKNIYLGRSTQTNQNLGDELLQEGYDGARIHVGPKGDEDTFLSEVIVVNPDVIKTKSQLTDIWNKAHGK